MPPGTSADRLVTSGCAMRASLLLTHGGQEASPLRRRAAVGTEDGNAG